MAGKKKEKPDCHTRRLPTVPTIEKIPLRTRHGNKPNVKKVDFVTAVVYKLLPGSI